MKTNQYNLVIDDRLHVGPFTIVTYKRLLLDPKAPNYIQQVDEIMKTIGRKVTIVQKDGVVVADTFYVSRLVIQTDKSVPRKLFYVDVSERDLR